MTRSGANGVLRNPERAEQPAQPTNRAKKNIFDRFAGAVTKVTGSSAAFIIALIVVLTWGVTGPLFHYSDSWQLAINTRTTIVTFLMVFVIQQSQNKDTVALHLKLNELIACDERARNRLVDIEDLSDAELAVLKKFYVKLACLAQAGSELHSSHSLDEATDRHVEKTNGAPGDNQASP